MKRVWFHDILPNLAGEMVDYCHTHSLSLIRFEETDVSDVSGQWDTLFCFDFEHDEDALLFKLRFNGT
jgi:hypothetical protein